MFQEFEATTRPQDGAPRLAALRAQMAVAQLDGFIIPRADAHQGEYVSPRDERLSWLTGFTGSAGFCVALADRAAVFIDGRYRVQVRAQVDLAVFTPVPWPETQAGPWLRAALPKGGKVGYDPWLHSRDDIAKLAKSLDGCGVTLQKTANLIDRIWPDQPAPALGRIFAQPLELAGVPAADKRRMIGAQLAGTGQTAAVLTLPDSISWLLNIRGADVARNPVVQAFAILHGDGCTDLFVSAAKLGLGAVGAELAAHLGGNVRVHPPEAFGAALAGLTGPVRVDPASAPVWVGDRLEAAGVTVVWDRDPCILPKARKTAAEIAGTTEAHLRDGAAMAEFLCWLDGQTAGMTRQAGQAPTDATIRHAPHDGAAPDRTPREHALTHHTPHDHALPAGALTEIDCVRALEGFRRATNALHDLSFDTIAGSGPNGAIVHYRVTTDTNRALAPGELFLIDSGGQYVDGTTDITRTVLIGDHATEDQRGCFTRVLQGMIAISRARWPRGLAGRDLDALARFALWQAGQDYDHGTGHGVGTFLSVHEGPQRISRMSDLPLEPGMILSNEPGYYREGAFGIRIENLVVVEEAPALAGGDDRPMLRFATLTFVPIDRRLIDAALLSGAERDWIDDYHRAVFARIGPRLSGQPLAWLAQATGPL